jgi:hypothetical protein
VTDTGHGDISRPLTLPSWAYELRDSGLDGPDASFRFVKHVKAMKVP